MDVFVNVVNQELKIASNLKNYVEGTREFIRFIFILGDEWNSLSVFAEFGQGDKSYSVYLDDNNSVFLPAEIKEGTCLLTLYGSNTRTIATTNYVELTIDKNILSFNSQTPVVTQSLYDQLVARIERFEDAITKARFG